MSEEHVGSLAENVMEALRENVQVATKVTIVVYCNGMNCCRSRMFGKKQNRRNDKWQWRCAIGN
jgi:hypothetical protein